MAFVLQVDFPYEGPYGDAMSEAFSELAQSIQKETGLLWKIWTENETERLGGGIYLFDSESNARAYAQMHEARLTEWGVQGIRSRIFKANTALSAITKAPL